ncbi:adenylosuccinate synthase, partial [Candidatus Peregrinibacteria bacterium CG11_big_fil_rev_8_21_14_0_20_46_8]
FKAYQTRVGSGPFPTELTDKVGVQIRNTGGEFGSTTGRPRRCGWFDAVAAQYAMRINGFTHANLTKVDVLNELPKIKIGIAYKYRGKKLKTFPADVHVLEKCTVEYEELPGWQQNLDGITTFEKLPKNCRAYIKRIEQLIGAPVSFIGTGKDRTEMIIR